MSWLSDSEAEATKPPNIKMERSLVTRPANRTGGANSSLFFLVFTAAYATGASKQRPPENSNQFMKLRLSLLLLSAVCTLLSPRSKAQPALPGGGLGGPPQGPRFGGAMSKLFGEHKAFTAQIEMRAKNPEGGEQMTIPGQF